MPQLGPGQRPGGGVGGEAPASSWVILGVRFNQKISPHIYVKLHPVLEEEMYMYLYRHSLNEAYFFPL